MINNIVNIPLISSRMSSPQYTTFLKMIQNDFGRIKMVTNKLYHISATFKQQFKNMHRHNLNHNIKNIMTFTM